MAEIPDYEAVLDEAILDEAKNSPEERALSERREQQRVIEGLGSRPVVVPVLVVANLLVFVAMLASGVSLTSPMTIDILNWGGNFAPLTLSGQWWRLWTSMFVHIGVLHVLMNMVVLWDAGKIAERLIGRTGFFVMYAFSGLVGSVASLAWNTNLVSAGASGAVFGVFGCLLGLLVRERRSVPEALRARLGKMAVILVGYNLVFGAAAEGIDMAAHVGGLGAGFVCGIVVALPIGEDSAVRRRARSRMLAAIALVVVSVGAFALPASTGAPAIINGKQVVKLGQTEVFYMDGATREQAAQVNEVLVSLGFFRKEQRASALVTKEQGHYQVGLVVLEGTADNAALEEGFRSFAAIMSAQVFEGEPVVISLLNANLNTLRSFEPIGANAVVENAH